MHLRRARILGLWDVSPFITFPGRKLVFLRGFLLPFSKLLMLFYILFDTELIFFLFIFFVAMIDYCYLFHIRSSTLSITVCLYPDILCMCLQSKMSIHQRSRPKRSSAMEGCETRPTARPKWWGKRRWFYSPSTLQTGSERKSDSEKQKARKGWRDVCARYFTSGCCWCRGGGSLDGWEGAN